MSTLIIPCAGKSSRFPNMKPKWMLTHPDGKLMIEKAITDLPLHTFDRIIITIVKEHSKTHEAKLVLEQVFAKHSKKIEILELDNFTSCQAETVYQTLLKKKVKGSFVSKDCDNYVKIKKFPSAEFVVGVDVSTFKKEINRMAAKSYLIVNDQNIIVDIVEKRICSNNICVGTYGFENTEKFIEAYRFLTKNGKENKGEIYLSHIISYLIGTKKSLYTYANAEDYEDWGTLEDWKNVQSRHATYFIDIDGVLLQNKGKYGKENWSNSLPVIEENMKTVKNLFDSGAQIVLSTARSEAHIAGFKKALAKYGIKAHAFVTNCNHSPRVLVNDFAPTNPHPSATAINIPRNGNLDTYLS